MSAKHQKHIKQQKLKYGKPCALPVNEAISTDKEKPIFSFHSIQKGYCISDCEKEEKASLADCLRTLSNLNWLELKHHHKHGNGCEKIAKNSIKAPIPENISKQQDFFLAFRFHGKAPMVGYREQRIFHILWLDRNHTLYS